METQVQGTPAQILVVDDERVMREGCARICQTLDCQVLSAVGGAEGLNILREEAVDVLLLDMMMPGISGMEVLERVQAERPDVVVIVITGYATVELAVEAMKRGAYDFVSKPFTPDQLRLVVKRALDKRRLEQEAERLRQERARSLRDVAEEQSRLRTIIHSMTDGVLVVARDGQVVLHNPPAARLLGLEDRPALGLPIEDVAPPEVSGMVRQIMGEPMGTARSAEVHIEGGGDLRAHAGVIHLSDGEFLGCVAVFQDITPFKEMDRMKSDFVAMVSHELRSPLSAIQQQLEVIAGGMAGEVTDKQGALLGRAQQRVKGLLDLINDLLDLAKIEAGRVVERREPIQLEPLLEKTVAFFQTLAAERGVQLDLEPVAALPMVIGDAAALEEVFTNLVSNAIAYTPSGGEIRVRLGERGAYVWVEVADTGIGISAEAIPKIFDRFYRVKDERTRHVVGTGLGLPIVKGIVEAHLGAIEVESEQGKGSVFRVLLPAVSLPAGREGEEICNDGGPDGAAP